jgi:hypothetical protein
MKEMKLTTVLKVFICECKNDSFEIITERVESGKKTYFRCTECDKDHQLDEVNSLD